MRAWEDFLARQERELGKETVVKWLRPFKVVRFDACNLYLEASDSFKAIWFEEHMRHKVDSSLFNNNNKKIQVHIQISSDASDDKKAKKRALLAPLPTFKPVFDEIDDKSRFDNFVTSQSNLLGYKLLSEACGNKNEKSKVSAFNPIYLFGRKGTGKTHLMMAMASELKAKGLHAIYVRAETFTEHVVSAIRTGEMQLFRKTYRNVDALLVDDVDIFSRKAATQEEFFHTFNTLHVEGKQIVLSSSSSPAELKFIEPRLVSRFEWGIVIPLQTMGREEMRKVLKNRSENIHFPLKEPIVDYLIETFGTNTKTLIRALDALILRAHLNKSAIQSLTIEGVKQILADLILEEEKAILTPGKIIRTVAEYYGIRMDDILSKSQTRESTLPRQIAMHLCREELHLPYMKIGDIFSRDHSTVMSSVNRVTKGLEEKHQEIVSSLSNIIKRLET